MLGIKRSLAHFVFSLPENWIYTLFGGATVENGNALNPKCQLACNVARVLPKLETLTPQKARKLFAENIRIFDEDPIHVSHMEDKLIPTPAASFIPFRLYNAHPQKGNLPIVIYFHGGGLSIGSVETHDAVCRRLAYYAKVIVASVDYRLAPEHPYPSAIDDCFQAYRYIRNSAYLLGGSPSAIAVAGDSAGGLLATAVCLRAKKEKIPLPVFQALLYPMTDVSRESESYETFGEKYILTRATMRWFIQNFTPNVADRTHAYNSPLTLDPKELKGMPPAYLATAGFDPLRDEGDAYAQALESAGVKVQHRHFSSLLHGYLQMVGLISAAKEAETDFHQAILSFFTSRKF
ncbi:alpha/beta hydrolase [Leptospira ognonensis]|uniref:Alpha/beta hydrolase n=1 Tax=Leptospira ognonensis TaxID=2484945 RepID=A0A4R9JVZ5_9LEPT|nr:alpha/beta hydrolase [Leptospira ognonensis]TGL57143.1 alpha/beta hydrolase [Leptospira ognonensis]